MGWQRCVLGLSVEEDAGKMTLKRGVDLLSWVEAGLDFKLALLKDANASSRPGERRPHRACLHCSGDVRVS